MDVEHVARRKLRLRREALAQAPGADGLATGARRHAEGDRIERRDGSVIGAEDVSGFGVDDVGEQALRHESLPVELGGGPVVGEPAVLEGIRRTKRDRPDDGVPHVPVLIAEDDVGGGKAPAGDGVEERSACV